MFEKVSEAGAAHRQHTLIWFSVISFGCLLLAIAAQDRERARVTYQVANSNLAISLEGWASWSSLDGALSSASSLSDTADWGSWGGWLASTARAGVAAASTSSTDGSGVGHDLVQRLVDLGRQVVLDWSGYLN